MTGPGVAVEPDGWPDAVPVGAVAVGLVFRLVGLGSGSKSADLVLLPELPVRGP